VKKRGDFLAYDFDIWQNNKSYRHCRLLLERLSSRAATRRPSHNPSNPMKTISIQELQTILSTNDPVDLIDVRTPAEFASVHVPGAKLFPLDGLDCAAVLAGRRAGAASPVYILCHSGARAKKAADKFAGSGFENCAVIEGGTQAWADAGLPVERSDRRVLSLDRQLQITIGSIVLTGVLLAQFVNPAWIWLAGFAGAGLIFAGLSGICMMRSLIAKMPWNQNAGGTGNPGCGV
jgi:rhodanese-related sulfurtransferase